MTQGKRGEGKRMTMIDLSNVKAAYAAWGKALEAGDVKAQARAEFFLNKMAHKQGITRAQLLAIVESE